MPNSKSFKRGGALGLAAGCAFGAAAIAAPVTAAPLVFECQVHANRPDHGRTDWRRRIIIDHATRTVKYFDDFGAGMTPRAVHPLVGENLGRITLEAGDGKISDLNPRDGHYRLVNTLQHFRLEGHCVRITDAPR